MLLKNCTKNILEVMKMATLKKKPVEETVEQSPYINEDEKEVISADGEQYTECAENVSSEKMNKVIELLQDKYNLRGQNFELTAYADKGNKVIATLANADYEVQFTIKSLDIIAALMIDN